MASIQIVYEFRFGEGSARAYTMTFDEITMSLARRAEKTPAAWTRLEFQKCGHCPLRAEISPHCPIARNLEDVAEHFKMEVSHARAVVTVHTKERAYSHETDMQNGLQSLFGLIMATSGCPHMDFLKPMARFHLPFATFEETIVRSLSIYLLQQFLKERHGEEPDFKMDQLKVLYENVGQVNQGVIDRLRSLGGRDADNNALIILDAFASLLPTSLSSNFTELIPAILMRGLNPSPDQGTP